MGVTARGFRYPGYGDTAGIPDYFYNLAGDVNSAFDGYDTYMAGQISNAVNTLNGSIGTVNQRVTDLIQGGSWTPTFGGANSAIGANANTTGHWTMVGDEGTFAGRIVFGSSASFGNGVAVVGNLPISVKPETAYGAGVFIGNGVLVNLAYVAANNTTFEIHREKNDGNLGNGYDLGTPPQSSILIFRLWGTRA